MTNGNGVSKAQLGSAGGLRTAVRLQGGAVSGDGRVIRLLLIQLFYHKSIVVCIAIICHHPSCTCK